MRAAKVQASLRIRAVWTSAARFKAVSQVHKESQIPGPSEWLGMRS